MERLIQIYEMQKELDESIFKKYSLSDKEALENKKILGFMVEVAEIANATKSYKYWSRSLPGTREEILDEYSDGLHFLLSLCLDLNVRMEEEFEKIKPIDDISDLFIKILKLAISLTDDFNKDTIKKLLSYYIHLGERLGFKMGDILEGYIKINKINKEKNSFYN
jgi:dimeric dUTPase (all-alpha-NTP-PPase superfamily)